VTERRTLPLAGDDPEAALIALIRRVAAAGADWIQLREKDLEGRALLRLAHAAIAAANGEKYRARILINDRLDVALVAEAAGVHLGEASLPAGVVAALRRSAGLRGLLLGASCHSLDGVLRAQSDGADYVFFGPVFETPSKAAWGPPQGLRKLAEAARAVSIPVLAIGGVTSANAAMCIEAGGAGIAAIRLFQQARDLPSELASIS
jgi:thiamine-phosphate pyrophosphorylase